jgi:hypothetical protein
VHDIRTRLQLWAWGALLLGALACSARLSPVTAFQPRPALGLALSLLGGGALLLSRTHPALHPLRWVGAAVLWACLCWCVLSQPMPLTRPPSLEWSLRGVPLILAAALWLWLVLRAPLLRRAVAAALLPSLAALALVAWSSPPHPLTFAPYYLAVDSHGTLYATDAAAPVIRVFAGDGSLRAKLRPGLASLQGPPGPGFSPPGPYNDPDRLGVPRTTANKPQPLSTLRPWPLGADDFWFCGLAVGSHDRLYVPDWQRGRMLRFAPDGRLEAMWLLPPGYRPSLGCVAAAGDTLYLSDETGAVLALDGAGHLLRQWRLPEPIVGGISLAPDGATLFALARARVYRLDTVDGAVMSSWGLPVPAGPLGRPYQAILALHGSVLVTDLAAHRAIRYDWAGMHPRVLAGPGAWPGELGQAGGLARDDSGAIYLADFDHRAVQRFADAGQLNLLYWSPDDDEID